jgi:uroporphyrinogen decarboxylase
MSDMLAKIPSDVVAMGNVDPAGQIRNGTPQSVIEATMQILDECSGYSNFVISSGCDIPHESPWENIDAFFDAAKDFYNK